MSDDNEKNEFKRQNSHKHGRVSKSWRKPRGKHSPMRRKEGHAPKMPNKGFRSPKDVRGLHPSGLEEVLVHNPDDLDELDNEEYAIRIASGVGGRKRAVIAEKADEMDLKLLNYSVEETDAAVEEDDAAEEESEGAEETEEDEA